MNNQFARSEMFTYSYAQNLVINERKPRLPAAQAMEEGIVRPEREGWILPFKRGISRKKERCDYNEQDRAIWSLIKIDTIFFAFLDKNSESSKNRSKPPNAYKLIYEEMSCIYFLSFSSSLSLTEFILEKPK